MFALIFFTGCFFCTIINMRQKQKRTSKMKKTIATLIFLGSTTMIGGCTNTEVGTSVGAAAGAGIGYAVSGGDALGTVIGAGAGALVGNSIGRSQDRYYYGGRYYGHRYYNNGYYRYY